MKCFVLLVALLLAVIATPDIHASQARGCNRRRSSVPRRNSPTIVGNDENSGKAFRNLAKKFGGSRSKFLPGKNSPQPLGDGKPLNMQRINGFQYRRSHSSKPGIPSIKPAEEK